MYISQFYFDLDGRAIHYVEDIDKPIAVPYICSACILINDKSLRFDLDFKKYYQEVDLCFGSWLKNKKVVISPHRVYHYGQGQMEILGYSREEITSLSDEDLRRFQEKWIKNNKLAELYREIKSIVDIPLPV